MKIALAWFTYGGIEKENADAVVVEMQLAQKRGVPLYFVHPHGDALISRSRSKLMSVVLEKTDSDVLFMLDHDITCRPGDILDTCKAALDKQAMVSGFVSLRASGVGFAGRPKAGPEGMPPVLDIGSDTFIEAEYLGAGFLAIPRTVIEKTLNAAKDLAPPWGALETRDLAAFERHAAMKVTECIYLDGSSFHDFFRPVVVPSELRPGKFEYLSEDWAFSWRVRAALPDSRQWLWTKPILGHIGKHVYTMADASTAAAVDGRRR
jgi:hypothetical protein